MTELKKAKEPFRFCTRLHLTELTGMRATTLGQMLNLLNKMPDSCIYHHTHRFLQQHQYLSPEPPNDFAYWVSEVLGEDELGEELASINTIQYSSIQDLKSAIVGVIEEYMEKNPMAKLKFAKAEEEFHFLKSISYILPTSYVVYDLAGFRDVLKKITIDSIYFHIFEARLRLEREDNDFSNWIETSLGEKDIADKISRLDPYTYTLEELRSAMVKIVEKGMA
ncbi:MAG: hypothetical protein KJ818_01665 [Candidatus Omnitrophica bacterium]|nr:hypothetical protein [Candidatus Omnitrophota bacterium]